MAALPQQQEHELPPGFRFYPTEEELVSFYLLNKLEGKRQERLSQVIPVVDICSTEPWDLPKFAGDRCKKDTEQWFFFTPRQESEARGGRPSRTTASGYWKATGSPGYVYSSDSRVIGVKKTMVFYKGKAPTGRKTKWKMNEYRAIEAAPPAGSSTSSAPKLRHEFSLCRVYVVSWSSRAFDRRPLQGGGVARETLIQVGETSSHEDSSKMVDKDKNSPISSETSNSGGENVNWGTVVDALVNPLIWDWELSWP